MPLVGTVGKLCRRLGEQHLEWIIQDFFSLSAAVDDFYRAPPVYFCGNYWYMALCPNGQSENNTIGRLTMFLLIGESCSPTTVEISLGIKTIDGNIHSLVRDTKTFSIEQPSWGAPSLQISELRRRRAELMPLNALTIVVTFRMVDHRPIEGVSDASVQTEEDEEVEAEEEDEDIAKDESEDEAEDVAAEDGTEESQPPKNTDIFDVEDEKVVSNGNDIPLKLESRSVIKFLHLQGKTAKQIHEEMKAVYCEKSPSYSSVKIWKRHFTCGRISVEDEPRKGRPCSAIDGDTVQKVKKLVMSDKRITIDCIMAAVRISYGSVYTILHEHLHLSKVCSRWVPCFLTTFQKEQRQACANDMLAMCQADRDDFFERLVIVDECWVYHCEPETKPTSKGWKHSSTPSPKRARMQKSSKKVMFSVFWDRKGVILTDHLNNRQTVNGEYYRDILLKLRESLKQKRRGKLAKGVLLLTDSTSARKATETFKLERECGYTLLPHSPHSPDLAPSDFFLFPKMKESLRGKRFSSDAEVISTVEEWFSRKKENYYNNGMKDLVHRWEMCVTLKGDYVEKT